MSPASKTPLHLKKQETEQLNLTQNRLTVKLSELSISHQPKSPLASSAEVNEVDEGPYPLRNLTHPNSCLVMEDNTLIIKIPYALDALYLEYLKKKDDDRVDI